MTDIDLDELKVTAAELHNRGGQTVYLTPEETLALIERVKRAEAVISQAMREEAKTQRIMTGRLPTAEASSATWRVLATYQNGADHDV